VMSRFGVESQIGGLQFHEPFGLFDFVALERNAFCVLSDSGTVQEECCLFGVPNVTIRDVTERPETLECGSNMLSGVEGEQIQRAVRIVLDQERQWVAPPEYMVRNVSATVIKIVLGYLNAPGAQSANGTVHDNLQKRKAGQSA
jgi:UDP-N-acetylglucosamine 2-epimerase (non-hydrolysing)